jgi:hypothetical protein
MARVALLIAVAIVAACRSTSRRAEGPPPASFLVSAGDSTYWVESDSAGVKVRRSPMLLTDHEGRFYELYLTDVDRSYFDAVIMGQHVWRRDLVTGDSLLLVGDSLMAALAAEYASRHPREVPLAPDEDAAEEPATHATTETELLDAAGPFLTIEEHVDIDVVGDRDVHLTRRAVVDVRDGRVVTVPELVGEVQARDVFRDGHRLLAVALDSIRRARDERARRAEAALSGFVFDSLSFALTDVAGKPAVAFMVPGRGVRAGGYALPLPPIPIVEGPWWVPIRAGLPFGGSGGTSEWRGVPYDVVARDDSAGEGVALSMRVGPNEWFIARVQAPIRRVLRVDPPRTPPGTLDALRRAFDESALYSGEVSTASWNRSTPRWQGRRPASTMLPRPTA